MDCTSYRHRWEMPLVRVQIAVSLLGLYAGLAGWIASKYVLLLLVAPMFIFVSRFFQIARDKANAVRVGPDQFPELWALYTDVATRLGIESPPWLYIKNGNGVVNAYALSCNRRANYVVLNAEVALMMARSQAAVEFVIAHELAHHQLRHVSMWRLVTGVIPRMIPMLGASTTRAQEYSADRLAHSVCARPTEGISLLMVGPWVSDEVNHDVLGRQARAEKDEWFVRLVNLLSTHAVGVKRFDALQRLDKEGYKSHGDML